MKKLLLVSLLISLASCSTSTRVASHSCPKEGHGPCYLCDDPKKESDGVEFMYGVWASL